MQRAGRCLLLLLVPLVGCSLNVPRGEVYGTYLARYPFGTDSITLNADGTFVQKATIGNSQPVIVHGEWVFEPKDSRVNLYGLMVVSDGFGRLRPDWQSIAPGLVSFDVEKHWFRVVMASASQFPYLKQ